jgi:DNA end-binding protein Ku
LADLGDFRFPKSEALRPAELKMAMQLIDSLSAKWQPDKYTDEYRDNIMKVIQGKLKGRRPKLQERETAQSADVVDLMARLRASLEGKGATNTKSRGAAKKSSKTSRRKSKHAA